MKTPAFNSGAKRAMTQPIDENEFTESWYIYKVRSDGGAGDSEITGNMTKKDFVDYLLVSSGTTADVSFNIHLLPDNNFIDKDGNYSKLSIKKSSIRNSVQPTTDEYLSKLLFNGFMEAQTLTEFEEVSGNLFFISKNELTADTEGKVYGDQKIFILYGDESINDVSGKVKSTKITLSYFDSNVSRNNNNKLIKITYYLEPIVPMNAKYVVITPKTPTAMTPFFKVTNTEGDIEFAEYNTTYSEDANMWNFDYFSFETDGNDTALLNIYSPLEAEKRYFEWVSSVDNWSRSNTILNVQFSNPNLQAMGTYASSELSQDRYIPDAPYRYIQTTEDVGFGVNKFTPEFLDGRIRDYRFGGRNSAISQVAFNYTFSEDSSTDPRQFRASSNFKFNSRLYQYDVYHNKEVFVGAGRTSRLFFLNDGKLKKNIDIDVKHFFDGNLNIDGVVMNQTLADQITDNSASSIKDYIDTDLTGFVMVNSKDYHKEQDYITTPIAVAHPGGAQQDWIMNWIDGDKTYGKGVKISPQIFKNSYSSTEYEKRHVRELNNENQIFRIDFNMITGDYYLEYKDANFEPAKGLNAEGGLVPIPRILKKSPQYQNPLNTKVTIINI